MGVSIMSKPWEQLLSDAVDAMIHHEPYAKAIMPQHTQNTPSRVVEAFKEMLSGYEVDVGQMLTSALFPRSTYTQMVHVTDITFYSLCAHHLIPFSGTVHFAYLPGVYLIGLSKIPRLVDAIARRLQIQEIMTDQIVDAFVQYVKPEGCGIAVRASHGCMQCRGVKAQTSKTLTTALRGAFSNNDLTRQEFLSSIKG